jgi:hypothetical protein
MEKIQIRDKHPGSATLSKIQFCLTNKKIYRAAPGEHLFHHNGHDLTQYCPMPHVSCNQSINRQSIDRSNDAIIDLFLLISLFLYHFITLQMKHWRDSSVSDLLRQWAHYQIRHQIKK